MVRVSEGGGVRVPVGLPKGGLEYLSGGLEYLSWGLEYLRDEGLIQWQQQHQL